MNVFVLEDDPVTILMLKRMQKKFDYQFNLVVAKNTNDLTALFSDSAFEPNQIDIAFLDHYAEGGLLGSEVAQQLLSQGYSGLLIGTSTDPDIQASYCDFTINKEAADFYKQIVLHQEQEKLSDCRDTL